MSTSGLSPVTSPVEETELEKRANIDKVAGRLHRLSLGEYWLHPLNEGEHYDLCRDVETLMLQIMESALLHCRGNESAAAQLLGMSRDKLRYRLKKLRSKAASTLK